MSKPATSMHGRLTRFVLLCTAPLGAACSALPEPPIGELRLALTTGGPSGYRLTNAEFAITGATQLTLSSEDASDPDVLQRALPAGSYEVTLLDGWQLTLQDLAGPVAVAATLVSDNPASLEIVAGSLETLTFEFETQSVATELGAEGRLRLAIEVDGSAPPHVLFSEFMRNPDALPDAEGEWLELYNAGPRNVELGGCRVGRDDRFVELDADLSMQSGDYLTLSNGPTPGFAPDFVYGGITLPNSGSFSLTLECNDEIVDQVTFEENALPTASGRSLSLSASYHDDLSNDLAESWCEGVLSYNGDLGTPGSANPACTP